MIMVSLLITLMAVLLSLTAFQSSAPNNRKPEMTLRVTTRLIQVILFCGE